MCKIYVKCSSCKEEKELSSEFFAKNITTPNGFTSMCKKCKKLSSKITNDDITTCNAKLKIALLRETTRAMIIRLAEAKYLGTKIY